MLSTEQLMKPRYEVIADWPGNSFDIGTILIQDLETVGEVWVEASRVGEKNTDRDFVLPDYIDIYPHLFRKLEWWKGRAAQDMPEYVKADDGQIYKIKEWDGSNVPYVFVDTKIHTGYVDSCTDAPLYPDYTPATLAEYTSYINSKK